MSGAGEPRMLVVDDVPENVRLIIAFNVLAVPEPVASLQFE